MLPGDIYVRFQSYRSWKAFKDDMTERAPLKIDAGPVYNMNPKYSKSKPINFRPIQRELVFDIDISDYNDVRFCCKESDICPKCWPLMQIGAKVLYNILSRNFGFRHILLVFSGRRGFHCWVSDRRARLLDNRARSAITSYLTMIEGGISLVKRVNLNHTLGLHPMVLLALDTIDEDFERTMIENQDFLGNASRRQSFIDLATDPELKNRLHDRKDEAKSTKAFWDYAVNLTKKPRARFFIHEVKLQTCYPRLDANVTKSLNHLLKLPFCVHPKTDKVCVPFDYDMIDTFDPFKSPKLSDLIKGSSTLDPYIDAMERFVRKLESDNLQHNKALESRSLNF